MAMFQQYQNGVQPVTGMAEAGANIGNMYMRGIGQMSEGLSKGIQEYYKNSALNDQATEEGHAVGQQLAFFHQMASMSPENAALLPMLDEQIETMKKVPMMSLTQKLGALNGAKATLSQFGQNLQMNQLMQQQKTLNALNEFKPEGENVDTIPYILKNTPFDPSMSPEQNIDTHLRRGIEIARADGAIIPPEKEIIDAYLNDIKGKVNTATDASGKPIDAQTKASFTEQLDKYNKYSKGAETGFADSSGATDYAKEAEGYAAASTSVDEYTKPQAPSAEKIAQFKASDKAQENPPLSASEKYGKKLDSLNKSKSELEAKKKELEKSLEYTSLTGGWIKENGASRKYFDENGKEIFPEKDFPRTQTGYQEGVDRYEAASSYVNKRREKLKAELEKVNSGIQGVSKELDTIDQSQFSNDVDTRPIEQILAERKVKEITPKSKEDVAVTQFAKTAIDNTRATLENTIRTNGNVSVRELITSNNKFEIDNNPTSTSVQMPAGGYGVNPNLKLPSRYSDASQRIQAEAEKLGIPLNAPMNADQMSSLMKALGVQSSETATVAKQSAEAFGQIKPSNMQVGVQQEQKAQEKRIGNISADMIVAGTKKEVTPLTLEQQRQQAKDWFRESKQFGYIPSAFNAIWEQQHPESQLKFATSPSGIEMFHDGKEWKALPQVKNEGALNPEQQAKYAGRIYNGEEIALGTGVRVKGIITGDEPSKFKTEMIHAGSALKQIDSLLEILQRHNGRSLSPETRAEAEKYVAYLKSMVRGQLFPSGRVAEWEQVILDKIVPNPTAILSLDSSTLKGLQVLRQQTIDNINDNASARGLQVSYNTAPRISSLASQARQANRLGKK
jgi:hypothetical protein